MNYKDTPRKEKIKWVKIWTNEKNKMRIFFLHYSADNEKDPLRDWLDWYENEKIWVPKTKWMKEYEWEFETASSRLIFGKDYCDFNPLVHFIPSFDVTWELLFWLDFGQSNPTAWLVWCYTRDWDLYIIDEYYQPEIPSVSSREMFVKFHEHMGITEEQARNMSIEERRNVVDAAFQIKIIDPTTKHKNRTTKKDWEEIPYSVIEDFFDNGWDFEPWINDVAAGITKIRELFQLDKNGKARVYIFSDKCPHLCKELVNYKYKEQTDTQARTANSPETPVKKADHAVDAFRYLVMSRPFLPTEKKQQLNIIQRDIQRMLRPTNVSASWDID